MRCVFGLIGCLLPVGSNQPLPRLKDVTLAECLLRSRAFRELCYAVQRLIPPHTGCATGPCTCCTRTATAWMQLVPFETPSSSGSGPGTSSASRTAASSSSHAGTSTRASGSSTSSRQAGSGAGKNTKQLQRVSGAVAVQALLQRYVALWCAFAHGWMRQRLRWQQVLTRARTCLSAYSSF